MNKNILTFLSACSLTIISAFAAAKSDGLPPRVLAIVDALIPLCRGGVDSKENSAKERFVQLLEQLAVESDATVRSWAAENEGTDLRAKLIIIADDFAVRSKLYKDISSAYFVVPKDRKSEAVVTSIIGISDIKIEESVRLPFEMWILAPPFEGEYQNALSEAVNYVGVIQNVKSLPVFKVLAERKEGKSGVILQSRRYALDGLMYFPSNSSLSLILGCADFSTLPESVHQTSMEAMRLALSQRFGGLWGPLSRSKKDSFLRDRWIEIFEGFPRMEISESQRKVFDELYALLKSIEYSK